MVYNGMYYMVYKVAIILYTMVYSIMVYNGILCNGNHYIPCLNWFWCQVYHCTIYHCTIYTSMVFTIYHLSCWQMMLLSLPLDLGMWLLFSTLPSHDLGGKRLHDLWLNFVKRNAYPFGDLFKLLTFEGISYMNIPHVSNRNWQNYNWKFLSKHQRTCS